MRARNLKPGYFKNEVIGSADPICGHIFQGLWGLADREGRLEYRLQRIHVEINAYREMETTRCAIEWLIEHDFVRRYQVAAADYLLVMNFREHQHPHVKEPPSKLPAPGGNGIGTEPAPGQHRASGHASSHHGLEAAQGAESAGENGKPGASTGPAPGLSGARPVQERRTPDSGLLKPDSGLLTPDGQKPLSGSGPEKVARLDFDDLRRAAAGRLRMPGVA
jgi:hypothetical protein